MKLNFDLWNGLAPKFHTEQLANGMAAVSTNTKPGRGILEAWNAPLLQADIVNGAPLNTKYMFLYDPTGSTPRWMTSPTPVEWATPAIPNDEYRFVVRSDDDYPKFATLGMMGGSPPFPQAWFRLGIGYPEEATYIGTVDNDANRVTNDPYGDIAAQGATDLVEWDIEWDLVVDDLDLQATEYKITYVDKYGRESAGSIPTQRVYFVAYEDTFKWFAKIRLPDAWVGDHPDPSECFFRIYKTNTGTNGSEFQYVTEVNMAARGGTYWLDATLPENLNEVISTDTWIGPPDDDTTLYPNGAMRGVINHPGGFIAGHTKHEVVFSEPYTVHAFPAEYRQSFSEEIVALVLNGNDIFVGTKGTPMIFSGVHPKAMSPIRLSDPYPLVSREAITEVGGRVFFASELGLIAVSGYKAENVSEAYLMDDAWKALEPETMRFSNYDDRLFIFTENSGTWVFNPSDPTSGLRKNSVEPEAFFITPKDGVLNYYAGEVNESIYEFGRDTDNNQSYTYESRTVKLDIPVSFVCAKVFANEYPVSFTLHHESESGYIGETVVSVPTNQWFFLPSLPRCERWHITATGSAEIRAIELATNPKELT